MNIGGRSSELILDDTNMISFDPDDDESNYNLDYSGTLIIDISSSVIKRDPIDKDEIFLGTNHNSIKTSFKISIDLKIKYLEDISFDVVSFDYEPIEIEPEWEDYIDYDD